MYLSLSTKWRDKNDNIGVLLAGLFELTYGKGLEEFLSYIKYYITMCCPIQPSLELVLCNVVAPLSKEGKHEVHS